MLNSCARVNLREEHVQGYFQSCDDTPIRHLYVLHFRGLSLALKRLHSDQLHFNTLDLVVGLLDDDEAVEGLVEVAVGGVDLALEVELRQGLVGGVGLQTVGSDLEVLGNELFPIFNVDPSTWHVAVELFCPFQRLLGLIHMHHDLVDHRKLHSYVGIKQLLPLLVRFQGERKRDRLLAIRFARLLQLFPLLHHVYLILFFEGAAADVASDHGNGVHVGVGFKSDPCVSHY
mmetsp:Transcript_21105/g.15446  ORF Transcript_21105/g.15446 Transcript_21105/m.15446 type:complete len:231 (-) Transcript_21105:85-777(-)